MITFKRKGIVSIKEDCMSVLDQCQGVCSVQQTGDVREKGLHIMSSWEPFLMSLSGSDTVKGLVKQSSH